MRKFIVVGALAVLGPALLAVPASASFDHHFRVFEKAVSLHPHGQNGFRFRGTLFETRDAHNRVGQDRTDCKQGHRGKLKCHAIAHFNGGVGGFGDIAVSGNIGRHDRRLNVVGGSHNFNGVAGKVLIHTVSRNITRLRFDLVR